MGACACFERKRSKQNLVPRMSLDLRELKLAIIWIHTLYFFSGWSSQYLTPQKTKNIVDIMVKMWRKYGCSKIIAEQSVGIP